MLTLFRLERLVFSTIVLIALTAAKFPVNTLFVIISAIMPVNRAFTLLKNVRILLTALCKPRPWKNLINTAIAKSSNTIIIRRSLDRTSLTRVRNSELSTKTNGTIGKTVQQSGGIPLRVPSLVRLRPTPPLPPLKVCRMKKRETVIETTM